MGPLRRRSRKRGGRGELTRCTTCGSDFVVPVDWGERDAARWWLWLRCGECGAYREVVVPDADARRYEAALNRGVEEIGDTLRRIDLTRMADEAEAFSKALELDVYDAGDFAV
jgi:hypothetical protein